MTADKDALEDKAIMEAKRPEPVAWEYEVNGTWTHTHYGSAPPPDDAYDEGTLRPFYGPDLLDYADRMATERDRSISRMVEMAEPGFIGAFARRDAEIERRQTAERQLAELQAKHDALVRAAERTVKEFRVPKGSVFYSKDLAVLESALAKLKEGK